MKKKTLILLYLLTALSVVPMVLFSNSLTPGTDWTFFGVIMLLGCTLGSACMAKLVTKLNEMD